MNIASAIWRYLEAIGHARAQRELRQLAASWALTHPALAQQIRQASLRKPETSSTQATPPTRPQPQPSTLALLQRP